MESNCIVNAAMGGWYPRGQKRLKESLIHHGFSGDFLPYLGWANSNYDFNCIYNVKAAAIEEAIKSGYTTILWLDCSVWALQNPDNIFDKINDEGVLMLSSGYNAAQTCSDKCLKYFDITRNEAEKIPDVSTGCFGFNYSHPLGKEFVDKWIQSAKDGIFNGSREHDNQSNDKRFLFYRQDQSCASIICGKIGIKLHTYGEYAMYYEPNMNENILFALKGM